MNVQGKPWILKTNNMNSFEDQLNTSVSKAMFSIGKDRRRFHGERKTLYEFTFNKLLIYSCEKPFYTIPQVIGV